MTADPPKNTPAPATPSPPENGDREARLAAALRENLKRRKAQARDRQASDVPDENR